MHTHVCVANSGNECYGGNRNVKKRREDNLVSI